MAARVDLKVVLLGKEYGGKTSLVERYLHGKFGSVPYQATIGAAFGAKTIQLSSGAALTLGIWVRRSHAPNLHRVRFSPWLRVCRIRRERNDMKP
eukprot:m.64822 g.64822  ORF g.64822 m.64822 type:complete len:95 (+) comp35283_c0_seq6:1121-1405(+)